MFDTFSFQDFQFLVIDVYCTKYRDMYMYINMGRRYVQHPMGWKLVNRPHVLQYICLMFL